MGSTTCSCSEFRKAEKEDKIRSSEVLSKLRAVSLAQPDGGQRRASLVVKSGGFALKNFVVSNHGAIEDCYDLANWIGEGGFGTVRKAKQKQTNEWRAVKTMHKSATPAARLQEEVEIMKCLDHPHIVRVVESFEDTCNVYVVMELCTGGELFDRIISAGTLSEYTASVCVRQMLHAVNYLHHNSIMHRDLKPQNWLLVSEEDLLKAPLKLIDFGLSKRWSEGEFLKSKVGTPSYVAPEIVGGRYNELVDVWSLGIITFAMLSGELPFGGRTASSVLNEVRFSPVNIQGGIWRKVSQQAKELISVLLEKDPLRRPSAAEALRSPWIVSPVADCDTNGLGHEERADMTSPQVNRLKAFSRMNQLKKAAFTAVAMQLNEDNIRNLQKAFTGMDTNEDGTISVIELREGLKRAGVNLPPNLDELIEHVDTDGSGVIDYTEFLAATLDKKAFRQEHVLWAAFKRFDLDGNGSIDKRELNKVLVDPDVAEAMHFGENHRVEELIRQVDTNGDGKIDFNEFIVMVKN